jgi:3-phenylpropionate/trans-cinnamate dioxygenase ferredoxin reductase subunit
VTDNSTFVVIGAGQAGGRAVEAMRAAGFAGRIQLVGGEAHVPYERPPLSKKLLTGDVGPETTYLHDPTFYEDQHIELRLGVEAVAIRDRLAAGARLVVIGGGYIGLEAAAAARARGCVVTVLEAASLVMNRVVAPEIGRFYEDLHRANGVDIRTDVKVLEFIGDGRIEAVVCKCGITLPADFVIVGVGVEANAGLAQAAGLVVDNGIVVDSSGRSSDEHIFAAGDVANQPNDLLGRRLRLESWQNAQNQSIAVARIMCGGSEAYQELPWFWSDQYGLNLQMIGLPEGWDRLVIRGDMAAHKFAAFYLRDRAIIGANAVNSPRDLRFARMLMEQGARPDPAALADQNIPLKSLLDVKGNR